MPERFTQQLRRRPTRPFAGSNHPLTRTQIPGRRKEQRPGEIGGGVGEHSRRGGHLDAAVPGGGHVDVVETDGVVGHDAQSRGRLDQIDVDPVAQHAQERIGLIHPVEEFGSIEGTVLGIDADVEAGVDQQVDTRVR